MLAMALLLATLVDFPDYVRPAGLNLIYTAGVFALVIQICFLALGLYNPKLRESYRSVFRRIASSMITGSFLFLLTTPLPLVESLPSALLVFAAVMGVILCSFVRHLFYQYDWLGYNKDTVLILGAGERASIIERRMRRSVDRQRFDIHGFVQMEGDAAGAIQKEKVLSVNLSDLANYVTEHNIQEIVVACDERRTQLPVDQLFACKLRRISVIEILDFIERETGQIAVNLVYPSWIIYSRGFSSTNYLRDNLDWLFNTLLALVLIGLTWPFMLLTIIAIKIEDGFTAPVLYRQERVGLGGKIFRIFKFRSMRSDAEAQGAVWAMKNDRRVTHVGEFIRKYRIDELPQLINVFRGDMGFVGPRPERPEFIRDLAAEIPYYNERHNVKPGLTGWAQLKYPYGASFEDATEKLKYDLYYIKHRSFLLDLNILFQTAEVVFFGKGR